MPFPTKLWQYIKLEHGLSFYPTVHNGADFILNVHYNSSPLSITISLICAILKQHELGEHFTVFSHSCQSEFHVGRKQQTTRSIADCHLFVVRIKNP